MPTGWPLALISLLLAGAWPAQAPPAAGHDVFAFVRVLDEAGARNVWPGFNPSDWPLAVFDGEKTILLRHPSPPPEFSPMSHRPGVLVAPGRHPSVVTNSTREIGGVLTATVIATPGQNVESTMLATVEEVFHVFWRPRHPSFRPNEMARYAYPVRDAVHLARLLAEDEALARALEASSEGAAARWAATALQIRHERTPALADATRTFETALETMEGTGNYAARRALGQRPGQTAARLRNHRPVEGIRWRFYDTGAALCFLLDLLDPEWKARSDREPGVALAEFLAAALAHRGVEPNAFPASDLAGFQARATAGVTDLASREQRLRTELSTRPGARVIVELADGAEPFSVRRFDPINLFVLDAGEVAQAHFLTLAGPRGEVEMNNPDFTRDSFAGTVAITMPAGRHPLADGIRQVTIVGIQDVPRVDDKAGTITVVAEGMRIELRGAGVRTDGQTIRITVRAGSASR